MPAKGASPRPLRVVERQVRRFVEIVLRAAVIREQRGADTARDLQICVSKRYPGVETVNDSPANGFDSGFALSGNKQDAEFIAAQACRAVDLSDYRPNPGRSLDQDRIPRIMSVRVVDLLEMVKVDQQQPEERFIA